MKKFGDFLLIITLAGAMIACEECTQRIEARPGQTVFYTNKNGEQKALQVPEDGVAEIPCDAKSVRVEGLNS